MKRIRYHEQACQEFLHEVSYFSAIEPRLGERFDRAIQAAEALVAEFSELGAPYVHGTRRVFPKRFQFSLIYIADEHEIVILAVAPFRRKPSYWKTRLNNP